MATLTGGFHPQHANLPDKRKQTLWKMRTHARSSGTIHWDSLFSLVTASLGFNIMFSLTSPASCLLYDSKSFLFFAKRMLCVCVRAVRACECVCVFAYVCVWEGERGVGSERVPCVLFKRPSQALIRYSLSILSPSASCITWTSVLSLSLALTLSLFYLSIPSLARLECLQMTSQIFEDCLPNIGGRNWNLK